MRALHLVAPILIIAVSVPLVLNMIPRNDFYGFRTPRTRSSDEIWYPANRVAGIALTIAGVIWLALAFIVPGQVDPARLYVPLIGTGLLGVAVLVSFLYLRKL